MKRDRTGKFIPNWDTQTKQAVNLSLTQTAWQLLEQQARSYGISRSELVERFARSLSSSSLPSHLLDNDPNGNNGSGNHDAAIEAIAAPASLPGPVTSLQVGQNSSERLALALSAANMGDWSWDAATDLVTFSPRAAEIFGISAGAYMTWTQMRQLLHEEDRERARVQVEQAICERSNYDIEYRVIHPNAMEHWVAAKGRAQYNLSGEVVGMLGVVQDVTEYKRAQQVLHQSEQRLRLFIRQIPACVAMLDSTMCYITASQRWIDTYKLGSIEAVLGRSHYELFPDLPPRWKQIHQYCLAGAIEKQDEDCFVLPDGSQQYLRWEVHPWYDSTGEVGGILVFSEDITAAKQAQQELQQSLQTLSTLVTSAPMPIVVLEPDTRVRLWNPAAERLFGWSETEVLGQLLPIVLDEKKAECRQLREAVTNGEVFFGIETYRCQRDGAKAIVSISAAPLCNERGDIDSILLILQDITERQLSEQALRQSEEWMRLAIQIAQLGGWRLHLDTNLVELDERMRQIWGEPEDAVMIPLPVVMQRIHPDDRERVASAVSAALAPQSSGTYEIDYRIVWNDGSERWVLAKGQAQFEGEGVSRQAIAFFGTSLDITERKLSEAALAAQEERYRYIFEAVSVAIWEEDFSQVKAALDRLKAAGIRDFRQYFAQHPEFVQQAVGMVHLRDVNQAVLTMFGARDKTQLLTSLQQIFVPETYEAFIGELLAIAAGESFFATETMLQTLQGDRFDVWLTIAFPPTSEPYDRVLVSLLDITNRKRAEAAVQESEERLRLALMAANQGLYDLNVQTGETIVSPEYARMLGYKPNELEETNAKWCDRLHPDDLTVVYQTYEDYIAGKIDTYRVEFRQKTRLGDWKWILSIGKIVSWDNNGQPLRMLGTHTDITARKQVEQEREQLLERERIAREQAETANRVKDEFLAVLSHELRSPLNPILGWSKMLQSRQLDQKTTARALATIERNARLQNQLIGDLLDVSRILQGKTTLNIAPVNLAATITAAMETVRLAAEAKSISIQTAFAQIMKPVAGDSARLQQIVWNLLSNAVKFTPEGGRIEVRLEQVRNRSVDEWMREDNDLSCSPSIHSYAQITVSDTGKGISPEFLPYVFDYFRQADSATTRKFGGLGLGLAIVRHLVELHGGTVKAESPGEGRGATFTVRLPLMKNKVQERSATDEATDVLACLPLAGVQILVVDDEADTRDYLSFVLEQAGATVTVAASADEALQALASSKPDVLLSDIGMPDVDGYMLVRQVQALETKLGARVPAVALTAYASEIDRQQALAAGFVQHLSKPVEPEELVKAIVYAIA